MTGSPSDSPTAIWVMRYLDLTSGTDFMTGSSSDSPTAIRVMRYLDLTSLLDVITRSSEVSVDISWQKLHIDLGEFRWG